MASKVNTNELESRIEALEQLINYLLSRDIERQKIEYYRNSYNPMQLRDDDF